MRDSTIEHVPVLASKLAELVSLPQDAVMVDSTIGHGGHSLLFGRFLGPEGVIVGLDCDIKTIQRAQSSLKDLSCKVILRNTNFIHIGDVLREEDIEQVDFILADLGIRLYVGVEGSDDVLHREQWQDLGGCVDNVDALATGTRIRSEKKFQTVLREVHGTRRVVSGTKKIRIRVRPNEVKP